MKVNQHKDNDEINPMEKLEDALVICKFGWFHVQLMFTTLISVMATTAVTTATSFVLPVAECDLDLNMMQKGLLNAIPFLGQVGASVFTGFLTDAFGRKIFLVYGNLGMFLCASFGAFSQTFWMLMIGKLLEGILMSLVFTTTASMVTEFNHKNVRNRVLMLYGSNMSISIMLTALIGWGILPQTWHIVIVTGYFVIHSWNIFLLVSALWSLTAALLYWRLPESPKFLLSHGQQNEALDVLKEMYHVNSGKDKDTFPIKYLNISETFTPTIKVGIRKQMANAIFEIKDLFRKPLLSRLIMFSIITFVSLLSYSALRLWYPQLSTIVENYQRNHGGNYDQFCIIINSHSHLAIDPVKLASDFNKTGSCVVQQPGAETYLNGILLGFVSLVCISLSGFLVDLFGQKTLMFVFMILCGICSSSLYWTTSSLQIAILISATCAFIQAAFSLQHSILVRVFPTTVRTMALSLILMMGRVGSLLGNVLFPVMLYYGCMVPFLTLSAVTLSVAGLIYFLPNPDKENNGTGDR